MTTHKLPGDVLSTVVWSDVDDGALRELAAGQLTKRLLMLRRLADELGERSATGPVRDALDLLAEVQRTSRGTFDSLFMYPHVGAGLTRSVRESRAGATAPGVSYLIRLAAAAAFMSTVDFRLELPDGTAPAVHLPGLGSVLTASRGRIELAASGDSRSVGGVSITVPDNGPRPSPGWTPLRPLPVGDRWAPRLDDLDPDRGAGGLSPSDPLSANSVDAWTALFTDAWHRLTERHVGWANQIARIVRAITPLRAQYEGQGRSASTAQAYGAIALTPPVNTLSLAATLIHETQHSKLNSLLDLLDLVDRSDTSAYYSPWRADPRPLVGLLHGCFAFAGVAEFWAREHAADPDDQRAAYELSFTVGQVRRGMDELCAATALTDDGRILVDALNRRIAGLSTGTPAATHIASLALDEHAASWRLRTMATDPTAVANLVAAWRSGNPAPPIARVRASVEGTSDTFVPSARIRLWQRCARGGSPEPGSPESLLASGAADAAARHYRDRVGSDPTDLDAWTALAVAGGRLDSPARLVWHDRPEVVYAVHRSAVAAGGPPPDPLRLAAWLAHGAESDESHASRDGRG